MYQVELHIKGRPPYRDGEETSFVKEFGFPNTTECRTFDDYRLVWIVETPQQAHRISDEIARLAVVDGWTVLCHGWSPVPEKK